MNTSSQLTRLGLFDTRVPRYTSYPTAPQFSPHVGPETFAGWIAAIPENAAISLYVHVPFCRRLCWFCACRTQGTQSEEPVRAYVETLRAELRLLAAALPRGVRLARLHWGGGTPTLLSPALIEDLAESIFAVAPLAPQGEFSVEIDPVEIDGPRLDALVRAGMTRASIGVQDFDPDIQAAIGRIQSFDLTRRVVDMIRDRGIASLNADILFGLPHQTPARMVQSVQKLLSLSPDRVALYGYAHVPWIARRQQLIAADTLPSPEARLVLFETARKLFVWDGYMDLGIDHFAQPHDTLAIAAKTGRLRRNFQGYTDDSAPILVGVGASSVSRFPQGYAQNDPSTGGHTRAVRDGRLSTTRGHVFAGEDRARARIIEALMCDFAVSRDEILRDHAITPDRLSEMFDAALRAFPSMIDVSDRGLAIPPHARPLTRMIARAFDAYDLSRAGHSSAI